MPPSLSDGSSSRWVPRHCCIVRAVLINQLESANFEIKSVDVLGVHYSATIHRWYLNWVSNKDKVVEKYGIRWYRIWVYFLAYSVM